MEAQKIVNSLNGSDNENKKKQRNGILLIVNQKVITYLIMKLNF